MKIPMLIAVLPLIAGCLPTPEPPRVANFLSVCRADLGDRADLPGPSGDTLAYDCAWHRYGQALDRHSEVVARIEHHNQGPWIAAARGISRGSRQHEFYLATRQYRRIYGYDR